MVPSRAAELRYEGRRQSRRTPTDDPIEILRMSSEPILKEEYGFARPEVV